MKYDLKAFSEGLVEPRTEFYTDFFGIDRTDMHYVFLGFLNNKPWFLYKEQYHGYKSEDKLDPQSGWPMYPEDAEFDNRQPERHLRLLHEPLADEDLWE